MNPEKKYFAGGCSLSLLNVKYDRKDEIQTDVELIIQDSLDIQNINGKSEDLEFIVSRHLSFKPECFADISVSFSVILKLNDEYRHAESLDYKTLKQEMIGPDSIIIPMIMSRISLIISQLTSSYGERPVVTPPSFMRQEE